MTAHQPRIELNAAPSDGGIRLDKFLSQQLAGVGRQKAAAWCAAGLVRIDGHRAKKSALVAAGSTVTVELDEPQFVAPEPDLALEVRLERAELVIVNKPAGMPSAPLRTGERGTLCGALLARYPEMRGIGYRPREPGIVHRLDTQTSGLVLAARTADAFLRLTRALERGAIHKRYLAVVTGPGLAASGEIARALGPEPAHPERVRVLEPSEALAAGGYARHKVTRYRLQQESGRRALVELDVASAFRHQIRAHLSSVGHPIVGDAVYGGEPDARLGARHALHASEIRWDGDDGLSGFVVVQPLPKELAALFERAR